MRPPQRRRQATLVLFTAAAVLALTTFASATQLNGLLTGSAPLPPSRSANPSGRLRTITARQRADTSRPIGGERIAIPSVAVNARWVSERLEGAQLQVPADVHVTGLWAGGGLISGRQGTVLIDGHINYVGQGDGALYPLGRVRPGALIATSTPADQTVWWRTVRVVSMPKQSLPQGIFTDTGARRLVLVTCGGALESDGHYEDNVVLYARPLRQARATAHVAGASRAKAVI